MLGTGHRRRSARGALQRIFQQGKVRGLLEEAPGRAARDLPARAPGPLGWSLACVRSRRGVSGWGVLCSQRCDAADSPPMAVALQLCVVVMEPRCGVILLLLGPVFQL